MRDERSEDDMTQNAPQSAVQPARKAKWRRRRDEKFIESARPHLEPGEEVREVFMGAAPWWTIWTTLWVRRRLVMVSDRSVYVFTKRHASFGVKKVIYKARLGEVTAHCGPWWLQVGKGPRVCISLGNSGFGVRKRVAAVINEVNATARRPVEPVAST
jgi:hypothetical protein